MMQLKFTVFVLAFTSLFEGPGVAAVKLGAAEIAHASQPTDCSSQTWQVTRDPVRIAAGAACGCAGGALLKVGFCLQYTPAAPVAPDIMGAGFVCCGAAGWFFFEKDLTADGNGSPGASPESRSGCREGEATPKTPAVPSPLDAPSSFLDSQAAVREDAEVQVGEEKEPSKVSSTCGLSTLISSVLTESLPSAVEVIAEEFQDAAYRISQRVLNANPGSGDP